MPTQKRKHVSWMDHLQAPFKAQTPAQHHVEEYLDEVESAKAAEEEARKRDEEYRRKMGAKARKELNK